MTDIEESMSTTMLPKRKTVVLLSDLPGLRMVEGNVGWFGESG